MLINFSSPVSVKPTERSHQKSFSFLNCLIGNASRNSLATKKNGFSGMSSTDSIHEGE